MPTCARRLQYPWRDEDPGRQHRDDQFLDRHQAVYGGERKDRDHRPEQRVAERQPARGVGAVATICAYVVAQLGDTMPCWCWTRRLYQESSRSGCSGSTAGRGASIEMCFSAMSGMARLIDAPVSAEVWAIIGGGCGVAETVSTAQLGGNADALCGGGAVGEATACMGRLRAAPLYREAARLRWRSPQTAFGIRRWRTGGGRGSDGWQRLSAGFL